MNNSRILRIQNAKFSGYHFYMNTNIWRDFQISISVPLIALKLDSVSINKGIASKFGTVKVSQDLNLIQNMSTQWNWQLSRYVSKVIECLEQNIPKQIDNESMKQIKKIFELKYGNTKLLGNTKHNQVKLVLAVFLSAYFYQYSIKLY